MALNTPRGWLISYDITNPRRLARLHRLLVKQATPLQYSVFHFEGSALQMASLMAAIEALIDPASDDVRGYQLPERPKVATIGRGRLPDDILLLSATSSALNTLLRAGGKRPAIPPSPSRLAR